MGSIAGKALCENAARDVVVEFLDDWSIATTGTDASDIAIQADADLELAYPTMVCYDAIFDIWMSVILPL